MVSDNLLYLMDRPVILSISPREGDQIGGFDVNLTMNNVLLDPAKVGAARPYLRRSAPRRRLCAASRRRHRTASSFGCAL